MPAPRPAEARRRRRATAAVFLAAWLPALPAAASGETAVNVVNASKPTRCAEEDNVYVKLLGSGIGGFEVEARHPPYVARIEEDRTAPDFSHCDMSGDPVHHFEPVSLTLYDDHRTALVGHRFARFWRPEQVGVSVDGGDPVDLHLLQVFAKSDGGRVEVLVLYPADGYWRLKPLPPAILGDSAYGSSFLIGPVEEQGRPLVALSSVDFRPSIPAFDVRFAAGGTGRVALSHVSRDSARLSVMLDPPVAGDRPFAALRSMFVTPQVADVAQVTWRDAPGSTALTQAILAPLEVQAFTVRFGRSEPSVHNTSAPALIFNGFTR
jgi:hypothetical protein